MINETPVLGKIYRWLGACILAGTLLGCMNAEKTSPTKEKPLHLYLLAGQSNMAGRGDVKTGEASIHENVFALQSDMTWGPAEDPLHFDKPGLVGVGPGLTFGRMMAAADTSVRIGLIPSAVGGSPIASWMPGAEHEPTNSRPYDDALSRTFRVLAQQGGMLKGIIWHQGESDRNQAEGYEDALVALVQRFRKEFQNDKLPFVAARLSPFYTEVEAGAVLINEAIDRLPDRLENIAIVSGDGFTPKADGVHLDAESAKELGRRYAKAMMMLQTELGDGNTSH